MTSFSAILLSAAMVCSCFLQAEAFVGVGIIPRVQLRSGTVMMSSAPEDDILDPKKIARGVGGVWGNLKSGQGIFGAEVTTKYAKQAIEIVEDQVLETAAEIRSEVAAEGVQKSDQAKPMEAPAAADLPADGKLDVTVGHASVGEAIGVTVKPTQKVGLLLKAWAGENDETQDGFRLIVRGVPVDLDAQIGECGLSNNEMITVRSR